MIKMVHRQHIQDTYHWYPHMHCLLALPSEEYLSQHNQHICTQSSAISTIFKMYSSYLTCVLYHHSTGYPWWQLDGPWRLFPSRDYGIPPSPVWLPFQTAPLQLIAPSLKGPHEGKQYHCSRLLPVSNKQDNHH